MGRRIFLFVLCFAVGTGALRLGEPSIRNSQHPIPNPHTGPQRLQLTGQQPTAYEESGEGVVAAGASAVAARLANQSTALRAVEDKKPRGRQQEDDGEEERTKFPPWVHWTGLITFTVGFLMCFIWLSTLMCSIHRDFRAVKKFRHEDAEAEKDQNWNAYLNYRFAYWFVWTSGSTVIVILSISAGSLVLGGIAYGALTGTNLWTSTWKSFVWLVAPDAGAGERSHVGAGVGACMSIVGLVIFALLLTLLQDGFTSYLDHIREGRQHVLETGHTLLIGLSDHTMPILSELLKAHEATGGTVICILSHKISKSEMEEKIMDLDLDMAGSKIIVAEGHPYSDSSLWLVSAASASSIIIIPDREQTKETRDAFVLRSLVGLRGKGWPLNGRILAVCSLPRNIPLLQKTGGTETDVVMLDVFLARLMVQCSLHQGLGILVQHTFGFDGSEFYIEKSPDALEGKTFADACFYYPSAVLCGVLSDTDHTDSISDLRSLKCTLCPGSNYRLKIGDELVLLAEDAGSTGASDEPMKGVESLAHLAYIHRSPRLTPSCPQSFGKGEKVLVMGWNDHAGLVVLELDVVLPKGSTIVMVSPKMQAARDAELETCYKRNGRTFPYLENVTTTQIEGNLNSRHTLEDLPTPVNQYTRIFVLADEECSTPLQSDTCTIGVLMQIREVLKASPPLPDSSTGYLPRISIVPEIQDPESEMTCQTIRTADFINTSGLPSQILATIAFRPRVAPVLDDILSSTGRVSFATRKIQDYILPNTETPPSVSFMQVQELAGATGDVVVGWSRPDDAASDRVNSMNAQEFMAFQQTADFVAAPVDWVLNPDDKCSPRPWCGRRDLLVVLAA